MDLRPGPAANQRGDQRHGAGNVLMQDAMALRRDHMERLLQRAQALVDDAGAVGVGDGILRTLKDGGRAGDVRQAALQFIGGFTQFDEAPHRHVAVVDIGMLRVSRLERFDAILHIYPLAQFVDTMEQRGEGHVADAEPERRRNRDDAGKSHWLCRRQMQRHGGAGAEPHDQNLARHARHDVVAAAHRGKPIPPAALAQIPRRGTMALQPDAENRVAQFGKAAPEVLEFGGRRQKAMDQNHPGPARIGRNDQIGFTTFPRRFEAVDGSVAGRCVTPLAQTMGPQFVVEQQPGQGFAAGCRGALDDLGHRRQQGDFIGIDTDDILDPRIAFSHAVA